MYSPERMVYLEKTSGAAVAVGSVGKQRSAIRSKKSGFTNVTERVMKYIFTVCAVTAVACVLMITIYMIISGAPAIGKIGLTDFLFGDTWYAKKEQFGILPLILTSVFGTFNAPGIEISGVNYMLYPAAFSIEPLAFLPQTELYNISMAHLGALYKGESENENTGKIRMDIDDDHQRTVLLDNDDGSTTTVNSYSVSGRVLVADLIDFEKLENHFLIGAGALNSQILKAYSLTRADGEKKELTVENIADFFFKIISGAVQIQDISGEISFNDLKKAFE